MDKVELKPHEKRAIVSHFLHDDAVFAHLCQEMFKNEVAYDDKEDNRMTEYNAQLLNDYYQMINQPLNNQEVQNSYTPLYQPK